MHASIERQYICCVWIAGFADLFPNFQLPTVIILGLSPRNCLTWASSCASRTSCCLSSSAKSVKSMFVIWFSRRCWSASLAVREDSSDPAAWSAERTAGRKKTRKSHIFYTLHLIWQSQSNNNCLAVFHIYKINTCIETTFSIIFFVKRSNQTHSQSYFASLFLWKSNFFTILKWLNDVKVLRRHIWSF